MSSSTAFLTVCDNEESTSPSGVKVVDVVEEGVDFRGMHCTKPNDDELPALATLPARELDLPLANLDEEGKQWGLV